MLNHEDQKRLEYVKNCFQANNTHDFSNNDVQELQDLLKLLCLRGVLQDLEIDNANAYRKIGDFRIFEQWLDEVTEEVNNNGSISPYAEQLLKEIVEHKDERGNCDSTYWEKRFENLSGQDDMIVRSSFKELKEQDFIQASWADNYPYYIVVTSKGLAYYDELVSSLKQFNVAANIQEAVTTHKKYDVFLSHANKDKLDYVDGLYAALQKLGIQIFYDKNVIAWGDDWKKVILDGTADSEFAIIVISENFFGREWTERELSEFLTRQNGVGQKIVLPLLHDITIDRLKEEYPYLGDIQVLQTNNHTVEEITILFARELIKRLK